MYSAHRTPVQAGEFARTAQENGFGAIIAAAGKAAHLAGALAANTTLPVIGIPVKSSTLDGLDALLSTVQMPSGMPVATVAIDGAGQRGLAGHPDFSSFRYGAGRRSVRPGLRNPRRFWRKTPELRQNSTEGISEMEE